MKSPSLLDAAVGCAFAMALAGCDAGADQDQGSGDSQDETCSAPFRITCTHVQSDAFGLSVVVSRESADCSAGYTANTTILTDDGDRIERTFQVNDSFTGNFFSFDTPATGPDRFHLLTRGQATEGNFEISTAEGTFQSDVIDSCVMVFSPDDLEVRRWFGPADIPAEAGGLGYTVSTDRDANHCELFVGAFTSNEFSEGTSTMRWLEARVDVAAQQGKLRNMGMLTIVADDMGEHGVITLGGLSSSPPAIGLTGFTSFTTLPPQEQEVLEFAFFIDVERPGGDVVRLWQSQNGDNFDLDGVFEHPGTTESINGVTTRTPDPSSVIFDQKRACD
jgi:hypothetical protein